MILFLAIDEIFHATPIFSAASEKFEGIEEEEKKREEKRRPIRTLPTNRNKTYPRNIKIWYMNSDLPPTFPPNPNGSRKQQKGIRDLVLTAAFPPIQRAAAAGFEADDQASPA